MRRTITLISVFTLLLGTLALPAAAAIETSIVTLNPAHIGAVAAEFQNGDCYNVPDDMDGWHFIATGNADFLELVVSFDTDGDDIADLVLDLDDAVSRHPDDSHAYFATPVGAVLLGGTGVVTGTGTSTFNLSHTCPGEDDAPITPEGLISVEKSATTYYERDHRWDIDKSVDTELGYEHLGLPKIWLYTNGIGDETATWDVDVTYEGYVDSGHRVVGEIVVAYAGHGTARIDAIDELGITSCETTGGAAEVVLPQLLTSNDTLTCFYSVPSDGTDGTNTATVTGALLFSLLDPDIFEPTPDQPFSESDTATYTFGDPDVERDAIVGVEDVSDLFGRQYFGRLYAADHEAGDVIPFTYSRSFAFDAYDECGHYEYDNTARVFGPAGTIATADATLAVNVQCMVFQGETVTGAGDPWSAIGARPKDRTSTWFEYTVLDPTAGRVQTFDLIQGRMRNVVGEVTITTLAGGMAQLDVELFDPWELAEVGGNVKVQPLDSKPTVYLQPGGFAHHLTRAGSEFSMEVPQGTYGYAIHLDAGYWMPDPDFGPTLITQYL